MSQPKHNRWQCNNRAKNEAWYLCVSDIVVPFDVWNCIVSPPFCQNLLLHFFLMNEMTASDISKIILNRMRLRASAMLFSHDTYLPAVFDKESHSRLLSTTGTSFLRTDVDETEQTQVL